MIPVSQTDTYVFWTHAEAVGWMHVLPSLHRKRILCVDAKGAVAWSLKREAREVTCLSAPSCWSWPEGTECQHMPGLNFSTLDALLHERPVKDVELYDGLVMQDVLGTHTGQAAEAALTTLLTEHRRWLKPGGWVYVGAANPNSLNGWKDRLRKREPQVRQALPRAKLLKLLQAAGLKQSVTHPYLIEHGKVCEVIPASGYRSTKNSERISERIKSLAYGRWTAPVLSPAYGLLASTQKQGLSSSLDKLINTLGPLRQPPGTTTSPAVLKQYLVFNGHKAIVTLGPGGRDDLDVVAVLTGDALATGGRNKEAPFLAKLAEQRGVADMVPHLLKQMPWGAGQCFVMNRILGVTLDQPIPQLGALTQRAAQFITDWHSHNHERVCLDTTKVDALVTPLINSASARNPMLADTFAALHAELRSQLIGRSLPLVLQHGDFKVENVIYDPRSLDLRAVIDWEHASFPGLPLLDLHYLLVYNRIISGAHWSDALGPSIVEDRWDANERAMLDEYNKGVGLAPDLVPAMRAMFMVHHLGRRLHIPQDAALQNQVKALLTSLLRVLSDARQGHQPAP